MIVIKALGVGVEVDDDVAVRDGVSTAVGVDEPVVVLLTEVVEVSLDVRDGLAPTESVGDDEDVALAVSEGSGRPLNVLDVEEVTVSEPDEEDVTVLVAEGVVVAVLVAVTLEESEILEVVDAEAPFETEPVGV